MTRLISRKNSENLSLWLICCIDDNVMDDRIPDVTRKQHNKQRNAKMTNVTAAQFAENHKTDADWVVAMAEAGLSAVVLVPGEAVTCNGFKGTVISHYRNGMYNVRVPGGEVCVDGGGLKVA